MPQMISSKEIDELKKIRQRPKSPKFILQQC